MTRGVREQTCETVSCSSSGTVWDTENRRKGVCWIALLHEDSLARIPDSRVVAYKELAQWVCEGLVARTL